MTFIPYQYQIKAPSQGRYTGGQAAAAEQPQLILDSIIVPVSKTIDLADINDGAAGTPGVVYEHDYFLYHPVDLSIQRLWLSTEEDTTQQEFSIQLVQRLDGAFTELSAAQSYTILPEEPDFLDSVFAPDGGAVYLRVRSTYQSTLVYVTLELLTTKVP